MKVSIPRAWTVGKSISFDPEAGARAEAAVAALAAQISAGLGGNILHRNLAQLQVGDDHPQYTGNAFPETITGQWNFSTIPFIQGDTLAEYIEDVVGGSFFDFLQDTTSVVWTYFETAQKLEANVPPEFVQDTVGAMLTDSTSIDFTYNDPAGTFTAAIIDEYVQDLVGAMLVDSTSIDFTYNDAAGTFTASTINANPTATVGLTATNGTAATPMRSDGAPALSQAIAPTWTGNHTFTPASGNTIFHAGNVRLDLDNQELQLGASQDLRFYHDGANSYIRNDTGALILYNAPSGTYVRAPQGLLVIDSTTPTLDDAIWYARGGTVDARTGSAGTANATLTGLAVGDFYFLSTASKAIVFGDILTDKMYGKFDDSTTSGDTRLLLYDVSAGAVVRVSRGASDSGGTGFRLLRIPN